ncbi:NAD(P)-dependent oxidoreductase [Acidobacteria bacterium ACD]|nr:MAG: NAD(P)-dependent oxidoreductase [Acidobacteriota bacterium]MCE7958507.1 NAD(P)-dependent oxidoreductase [Acidobacteria bacterium ACB2]MDL1950902.1 NAD(P)-dependent oxidoreductase [Acidobacteria bacterium ACD]
MPLPRLVLTGSSGFVGRHLLVELCDEWEVLGIARESQVRSGSPSHPNLTWRQVDIGDRPHLTQVLDEWRARGPTKVLIHLAAHYDFTGDEDPEYYRTNVQGLRNVLDLARGLGIDRFVFSSSTAASSLPAPGGVLDETSRPDGDHIYARTKRLGEEMLAEYRSFFPSVVVRFAAMFSDWCEYPPLFVFLSTWLSDSWNRSILGGRGLSAIPYLHVRDAVSFLLRVLDRRSELEPGEVLLASPDGAVSHRQLFEAATHHYFGGHRKPLLMPKALCGPGMWVRDVAGRLTGERPFERPWMARYIDQAMTMDASRTRARLGWAPRERLEILRRLPFLVENLKSDPLEWNRRNRAAMKRVRVPSHLILYNLLETYEEEIIVAYSRLLLGPQGPVRFKSYQRIAPDDHEWNHRVVLGHLKDAVRTRDRNILLAYCRSLAERRFAQGFEANELCSALEALNLVCFRVLRKDPVTRELRQEMVDLITAPLRYACDESQEVFDRLAEARRRRELRAGR